MYKVTLTKVFTSGHLAGQSIESSVTFKQRWDAETYRNILRITQPRLSAAGDYRAENVTITDASGTTVTEA